MELQKLTSDAILCRYEKCCLNNYQLFPQCEATKVEKNYLLIHPQSFSRTDCLYRHTLPDNTESCFCPVHLELFKKKLLAKSD